MSGIVEKSEDQEDAEAEVESFKDELGPFVVAAETTRMPMVFTDATAPGDPIIFANDSFLELTGYDREEVLAQTFDFVLDVTDDADANAAVAREIEDGSRGGVEVCCKRKTGERVWCNLFVSAVRDEEDVIVQHFASFVDLSRHKAAQAASDHLIDELNHRVKNTLATVQSIVAQALRSSTNFEDARESIESRLLALSRSHDLLSRANWEGVGLSDLLLETMEPFGVADGRAERFTISGDNVILPPKATLALGIVFHELATNAVKYGAFSNEVGSVLIDWAGEEEPDDRLVIRWREQGGPPVVPPARKGFGSRVIERGLAHELNGQVNIEYRPEGVSCVIGIPRPLEVVDA